MRCRNHVDDSLARLPGALRLRPIASSRRLAVPLALALTACLSRVTPVIRPHYDLLVPVVGAPRDPIQGVGLEGGVISTGPGPRLGVTAGMSARPWSEEVGGGAANLNLVAAVVPKSKRAPFLFGKVGLGVIGSTILTRDGESGGTLDLFTPQLQLGVGYGIGKGLALNVALAGQYLWHAWNDHKPGSNQLLVGLSVGIGFFDPGTTPENHLLEPLLRSSVTTQPQP